MNSIETLTTFFGWCTVINVIALAITSIMLMLMRNFIPGIHGRMFGVNKEDLPLTYVQYGEGYIRLSLTTPDEQVEKGCQRLESWKIPAPQGG